eukprot:TRINITY_DN9921_c0_g1_i1.p1 TRINITY_DN9921_c0_g1~~TRINITY_DN9921_c0_g1_i1.p1  ORF type:complete len:245 (+),score=41.98 TRINITY_DN9921_c0_g1_i1:37-771(+)
MDLFQGFCEDFEELVSEIKKKLDEIKATDSIDERKRNLKKLESTFKEAEETLGSLNLSARQSGRVDECQKIINQYRSNLNNLKSIAENAEQKTDRAKLLSGGENEGSLDDKEQFISLTQKKESSTRTLEKATKDAEELVELGGEIITNLGEDREKIIRSRNKLRGVNETMDQATRKIRDIGTRILGNKIIRLVIILALILVIATIVFMKFFYNSITGHHPSTISPTKALIPTLSPNSTNTTTTF